MSSPSPFPTFYRTWFNIIDPLCLVASAFFAVFQPAFLLSQTTPSPVAPIAPETQILLDQAAGFFLFTAFLESDLLRAKATDIIVWRIVQLGIFVVDLGILGAYARALSTSGRLSEITLWTSSEVGAIFFTGLVALIRMAFLARVGFKEEEGGEQKKDLKKKS